MVDAKAIPPHPEAIKNFFKGVFGSDNIPGSKQYNDMGWIYVQDDNSEQQFEPHQLDCLTNVFPRPLKTRNGLLFVDGCTIYLPNKLLFHALKFTKDLNIWEEDIKAAAKILGLRTAHIDNNSIILSDGTSYLLSECQIDDPDSRENHATKLGLAWPLQQDDGRILRADGRWYTIDQFREDYIAYAMDKAKKK